MSSHKMNWIRLNIYSLNINILSFLSIIDSFKNNSGQRGALTNVKNQCDRTRKNGGSSYLIFRHWLIQWNIRQIKHRFKVYGYMQI